MSDVQQISLQWVYVLCSDEKQIRQLEIYAMFRKGIYRIVALMLKSKS